MRLSASEGSPNYFWERIIKRGGDPNTFKLTVNGTEHTDSVEADDVEGWADVLARDEHGDIIQGGDDPKVVRLHGVVAFSWQPLKPRI